MVSYLYLNKDSIRKSISLNPYCSGRWSRTTMNSTPMLVPQLVLILIVVDDGLVQCYCGLVPFYNGVVLILIVVDDGLVLWSVLFSGIAYGSLNPYCSGRWSRTANNQLQNRLPNESLNPYCSGRWSRT